MNKLQRRKAVFTALSKFFQSDQLVTILKCWDEEFSEQPVYALNAFISRFIYDCEPPVSRTDVFREIIYQLRQPDELLLEIPDQLNRATTGNSDLDRRRESIEILHERQVVANHQVMEKRKKPLPVELRVFVRFMDGLFEQLPENLELAVRNSLIEKLGKQRMSINTRSALHTWLQGETLEINTVKLELLRDLVGVYYIEVCERVGPVKTDAVLAYQAQVVQETEDGEQYSPYNFM